MVREKVELDDIIGIVKTDKPTNSVKLKKEIYNHENYYKDRFVYDGFIQDDGKNRFIRDDYTGKIYCINCDNFEHEMLTLLNEVNRKYLRQKAIARVRRNEILARVDLIQVIIGEYDEIAQTEDYSPEYMAGAKSVIDKLTSTSFEINEYILKDTVLDMIDKRIDTLNANSRQCYQSGSRDKGIEFTLQAELLERLKDEIKVIK